MNATAQNPATDARIKLAKAMNYVGMAMAMLRQGELYAAQAIESANDIHDQAKAQPFDPNVGDQVFAEAAYGDEYAKIVQALNQLECAAHDAIEIGGRLGRAAAECAAMPDDGTDAWLRIHSRTTMTMLREVD